MRQIYDVDEPIEMKFDTLDRDSIATLLKNNEVSVTFFKVNGEKRVMRCTLMEEALPVVEETVEKIERAPNLTSLPVFDLDKQEWRSFRLDGVVMIKYTTFDGEDIILRKGSYGGE